MTRHAAHWSLVGFVGLLLYMNTGCTRSIELKPASVHSQSADTHLLANDERVPLVMDSFHLSRNGAPQNPSTETERRILNRVQETHLFSTLIPLGTQSDSLGDKTVSARHAGRKPSSLTPGCQPSGYCPWRFHVPSFALRRL